MRNSVRKAIRKTLATMNPVEARQHYEGVVRKRYATALAFTDAAMNAPKPARRELTALADRKFERARKFASPSTWHRKAALERKEQYGVGVAAAFLAAHGWHARDAAQLLGIPFDAKPERPAGWDNPRSEWFDVYNN